MENQFCIETARKLRDAGYARKDAMFYARYFCVMMLSVSGIIETSRRRKKGAKLLGDETPRSLLQTLAGLIVSTKNTGAGIIIAAPVVVDLIPSSSRLRAH